MITTDFARRRALLLVALLALSAGACKELGLGGSGAATAPARELEESAVAARVNGEPISLLQVERHAAQRSNDQQTMDADAALQELVNLELLRQEAVKQGIDRQPQVVEELARQQIAVLANALIEGKVTGMQVSDEDLRKEYQERVGNGGPREYRARHILLESEAEARQVIAELAADGDFEQLARDRSTGPSGPQGGDLGWFRADTMVPPFAAALEGMSTGETSSEPVQTRFGWHVIKLEETRDIQPPAFEDVREQLRPMVINGRLREFVEGLRAAAKVELKNPE